MNHKSAKVMVLVFGLASSLSLSSMWKEEKLKALNKN